MKMNKLQYVIFIGLAFGVQLRFCDRVEPQIKVVGSQINYLNPSYSSGLVYTISKVNETFNNIKLYWNIIKDAPADIKMYLKVFVTDSTYQGGTLVLNNVTPVCKENKNRQLLPNTIVVPKDLLNTQCIKKGPMISDSFQLYRFEVLLPDLEKIGSYYKSEYVMGNEHMIMFNVTLYSEWGYLNKN